MLSTAGVFAAGMLVFNKVLFSRCYAASSCIPHGPTYDALRRREVTIRATHPLITSIDLVHLPSNSPTEDRFALGGLESSGTGLFAVIDGHASPHCSEHLKHALLPALAEQLRRDGIADKNDRLVTSNPYNTQDTQHLNLATPGGAAVQTTDKSVLEVALKSAFLSLDNNISESALKCVREVSNGRSLRSDSTCMERVMRAVSGACALVAVVTRDSVHVGSTGDCRVVVGRREGGRAWSAVPLSVDQNARNEEEVRRLEEAHPGEESTVIMEGRLLGGLMPLRSFGDVVYKWPKKYHTVTEYTPPFYKTPPYLTAEPVVTSKSIDEGDGFMILATDGLWDMLTSQVAVETVGRVRDGGNGRGKSVMSRIFGAGDESDDCGCVSDNAATVLLWEALGGDEASVSQMLRLPQKVSRLYRDDISIMVVHFKRSVT